MTGHYAPNKVTNELWGLALYEGNQIITCSDDATLRVWDPKKRTQINTISLLFDKNSLSGNDKKAKGPSKTPK
jgi:WD40 repeat protein